MPSPANVATLSANGMIFSGWKSLSVRLEYGTFARSFQATVSDVNGQAAQLLPGAQCVIQLGGKTVFTGWITTRGFAYDANSHDVVIAGRSLTTDLVDSAMPMHAGDFDGYSAEQAIRGALAPHKVDLVVNNPSSVWSKPFPFLNVNPGERVMDFIERVATMRGGFVTDDEKGRLCVGQGNPSAASVADLREGGNILRCTGKLDDQRAVSQWNTLGQQPGVGDDFGTRAAAGQVNDPIPRANRQVVAHMPHPGDSQDGATFASMLAARAGWETVEVEATVAGWFKPSGDLWQLTDNCSLYSPMALPAGTNTMKLGTQAITFSQSSADQGEGTTTTLTLIRPEFLAPFGNVGVQSDGAGNIVSNPGPAQAMPPDYQGPAGIGRA